MPAAVCTKFDNIPTTLYTVECNMQIHLTMHRTNGLYQTVW